MDGIGILVAFILCWLVVSVPLFLLLWTLLIASHMAQLTTPYPPDSDYQVTDGSVNPEERRNYNDLDS